MQRCGFCSMLSGALRRVMCVGSRRDSTESYYRELGDQDTLKIEDKSSDLSEDCEETSLCVRCQETPHGSPRASAQRSPLPSRAGSPQTSPRPSRQASPRTSPRPTRHASVNMSTGPSPRTSPRPSRQTSPQRSPQTSPQTSRRTSPKSSSRSSPRTSPQTSRRTSPKTSPPSSRRTSPKASPWSSRRSSPKSSPSSSSKFSPRKFSWLRYTRGFRLYYLHSDVATDSMEERDPEHYEMKLKKTSPSRFLTLHKRRKRRLMTRCLSNDQALLDDLMLGQVQCILNQSAEWKFNAFTLETVSGGRCLPVLCVHLFQSYGLFNHFQLDPSKVWKLFSLIEEGYHSSNPYHNSIHAADVTQAMHCFLQQKRIRAHMTPLEILASLLAAIAHDLDHPGVNQPFLIATSNHLAALYNNTSVLENHHWRSAMSCLVESGILDQLPPLPGLRERLETQISSLILATDITRQQEYLTHFKNHLDKNTLDMTKSEHRHLVLQIALKCADISNPCRPWEISRKWSLKVCEEFFRQGDYERLLDIPVTPLCDRHSNTIPKIQTGFFKFVVTPLISEWHKFLQNDLSSRMLYNLLYNKHRWEALVKQEENDETKTDISDTDMADDDLETDSESNKSESARPLLPPRRASLNPDRKKNPLKDQLRRFSVPLNVFQDVRFRTRDRSRASLLADSYARRLANAGISQPSVHSQLSVPGHCSQSDRLLNSEKLVADSTIASITTPAQAARLNTVLKEGGSLIKLVRQKTIPPLESTSVDSLASRPLYKSSEDADFLTLFRPDFQSPVPGTSKKEPRYSLPVRGTKYTDSEDTSEETPRQKPSRREASTVGSQLRDNLTWIPLELDSNPLLQRRRKSMPAEVLPFTPRDKKIREVPTALPLFMRRTYSSKESWTKRRGSAPSPVAPSELRGLAALGSLRHSVNGGRRKPSFTVTCQQWFAKAAYGVQERTLPQFPRRSSLPVEVFQPTNSGDI